MELGYVIMLVLTQLELYQGKNHDAHYYQADWNVETDYTIIESINYLSEIQCLHRCNMRKICLRAVFEGFEGELIGECILLKQAQNEDEIFIVGEYDMGNLVVFETRKAHVYGDCSEAFDDGINENRNIFLKKPLGWHYCAMDVLGECGSGGWVLAMTIDGQKSTFNYDSKYWTNRESFNATKALTSPLTTEAKYNAFSNMPVKYICVGMKHKSGRVNYLKIDLRKHFDEYTALLSIFSKGKEIELKEDNVMQETWLDLLDTPLTVRKICKQGFNIQASSAAQLRLGLFMNEDVCKTNWVDVWIGAGAYPLYCTDKYTHISAGAHCCLVACKDRGELPITYLFIK